MVALVRTDIANRALDEIGAAAILSIDDTTQPAQLCARKISPLRDALLRRHPWNFAMARASLTALPTPPVWGFAFAYTLPADYLRMGSLNVSDPETVYKIEGGTLVTDIGPSLDILYVQSPADSARYDPLFLGVLVLALARDLAKPVANDSSLRDQLNRAMEDAFRTARSADAAEGTADQNPSNIFVLARG